MKYLNTAIKNIIHQQNLIINSFKTISNRRFKIFNRFNSKISNNLKKLNKIKNYCNDQYVKTVVYVMDSIAKIPNQKLQNVCIGLAMLTLMLSLTVLPMTILIGMFGMKVGGILITTILVILLAITTRDVIRERQAT